MLVFPRETVQDDGASFGPSLGVMWWEGLTGKNQGKVMENIWRTYGKSRINEGLNGKTI